MRVIAIIFIILILAFLYILVDKSINKCEKSLKYGHCIFCKWFKSCALTGVFEEKHLKLPFNVGDTLYRLPIGFEETIESVVVCNIRNFTSDGVFNFETSSDKGKCLFYSQDIGKTVFLTKDDAEIYISKVTNQL